jgi:hypothetical protein
MKSNLLLLSIAAICNAGCSDTTTGTSATSMPFWTAPKVGNTFLFASYTADSLGRQISFPTRFDSMNVLQTGVRLGDDSNLVRIGNRQWSALYSYRRNGDVAIAALDDAGEPCWWDLYPVGSRTTVVVEPAVCHYSSTGTAQRLRATVRYVASEEIATPAGTFSTHRIVSETNDGAYRFELTEWFAPSLGMRVRSEFRDLTDDAPNRTTIRELSSYTMK